MKMNGVISVEHKKQSKDSEEDESVTPDVILSLTSVNTARCVLGGDVFVLNSVTWWTERDPLWILDTVSGYRIKSLENLLLEICETLSFLWILTGCDRFFLVCTIMYAKGILTHSMQTNGYRTHCNNAVNYVSKLLHLFYFLYTVCIYELSCNLNCMNKLILKISLPPVLPRWQRVCTL